MKPNDQTEQDEFAASFDEDMQKKEMTEDEAFGLTPDPETPDETEAEVAEEPAEQEPAEAPTDTAGAEAGDAGPTDETSVVVAVEPGAQDQGVEVMSPEDVQREKSWMGRLKAKEAELKAREEALKSHEPAETPTEESSEATTTEAMEDAMDKVDSGELTFEQAMKTLESDFGPDFARMLSVIAKRIGGEVADERANAVRGELDGLVGELRNEKEKAHYEMISDAHPDFMDVAASAEFKGYVDSLPGSEQEQAMQVIHGGSAKQINALLSAYKESIKTEPQADQSPVDESAMDAAEGVRSAGLKIPEKPAKADDYEAAWAEFA